MADLDAAAFALLAAIAGGGRLRDHRDIDGGKRYSLIGPDGAPGPVSARAVEALTAANLIDSNKKFPAATYWLTEDGKRAAEAMSASRVGPLNV